MIVRATAINGRDKDTRVGMAGRSIVPRSLYYPRKDARDGVIRADVVRNNVLHY
jgi:hypothetical protein